MFCTNCGSQIADDARFCTSCGASQTPAAAASVAETVVMGATPEPAPEPAAETVDPFAPSTYGTPAPEPEPAVNVPPTMPMDTVVPDPAPYPGPVPAPVTVPPVAEKKKSKAPMIIGIVVGAIVVIGIIIGIVFGVVMPKIHANDNSQLTTGQQNSGSNSGGGLSNNQNSGGGSSLGGYHSTDPERFYDFSAERAASNGGGWVSGTVERLGQDSSGNWFVLVDSDTHRYTRSELANLTDVQLCIARNEIYARHDYNFRNTSLYDYFWDEITYFYGNVDDMNDIYLNDTERANADLILAIENERNSPWVGLRTSY